MIKIKETNKDLVSRLYNFKFEKALMYLKGESKEVKEDVKTLASVFKDCGWIDGTMGEIILMCLDSLGVYELLKKYEKEEENKHTKGSSLTCPECKKRREK